MSDICYDRYNRAYYCNRGLSYGARIGIGIGIAAGIIALIMLCSYWKRRQLKKQFTKYRPPALPVTNDNNYANNPPPPNNNNWQSNPYGSNPPPPPSTYQPSMAGNYGEGATPVKGQNPSAVNNTEHEHGYEWEQAREQERLEREAAGGPPPPGYDMSQNHTGGATYAPPVGAPTGTGNTTHYTPPPGAPPPHNRAISGTV